MLNVKICIKCGIEKPFSEFSEGLNRCKQCKSEYQKKYREEYKREAKNYRENKKETISIYNAKWYEENKEEKKAYRRANHSINKESDNELTRKRRQSQEKKMSDKIVHETYLFEHKKEISIQRNKRQKERRENDPIFKSKQDISSMINQMLKLQNSSKNGKSCLQYLPWTKEEYVTHIEWHFRQLGNEWMTWQNKGRYVAKTWDDNNQATWTWQLDHIIPHSDLPYVSMEDDNFKKCWALENLRPLSAKQNALDGITRIRHAKNLILKDK